MRHHSPRSGLFRRWLTTTTALAGVLPVLALTAPAARANPEGGSVVQGAATITQTNPKTVTVNQTTDKAVINWRSFSIGADETTRFNQPSSSSTTLNRVTGDQVSKILGNLSANGKVFLVNPNGIVFGAGSKIDVAALVASTADIKNENFMAGNLRFDIPGKVGAEIINQGSITAADGGLVALVSPVLRNSGIIQARLGKVALASANGVTLDLYGDNLILFQATDKITQQMVDTDGKPVNTAIDNTGQIYADGGRVLMTANTAKGVVDNAINTTGLVSARTVEQQGGEIVLKGEDGGIVQVVGTLDASGKDAGQKGGTVNVLGEKVGLVGDAVVDVSGDAGGGTALIGGDYLGKGSVRNSDVTYAGTKTVVNANAITTGKGGKVVLWSDDTTRAYGSIYAKGGSQSGDGGFIETSGKNKLAQSGTVDASASYGAAGTWLMDPGTIYVRNNLTNSNIDTDGANCIHGCFGNYAYFQPASDADTYISAQSIANALRLGNSVWLSNVQRSEADINIEGDIEFTPTTVTGSNDVGLFLWAGRDINVTDGSIRQIGNNGLGADLFVMLNAGYGGGVGDVHVGKIDKTTSTIDVGASVSIYGQNVILYRTLASSNEYTIKSGNDVEIARRNANDPSGFPRNATMVSLPDRAIYAYSNDPNDRTDHGDISMFTDSLLLQSGSNGVPELSLNGTYYVSTGNHNDIAVNNLNNNANPLMGLDAEGLYATILSNNWADSYSTNSYWLEVAEASGAYLSEAQKKADIMLQAWARYRNYSGQTLADKLYLDYMGEFTIGSTKISNDPDNPIWYGAYGSAASASAGQKTANIMIQAYRKFGNATARELFSALVAGRVTLDGIGAQQEIDDNKENAVWRGIYGADMLASQAQKDARDMMVARDKYATRLPVLKAALKSGQITVGSKEWLALMDGWDTNNPHESTIQKEALAWLSSTGEPEKIIDKEKKIRKTMTAIMLIIQFHQWIM